MSCRALLSAPLPEGSVRFINLEAPVYPFWVARDAALIWASSVLVARVDAEYYEAFVARPSSMTLLALWGRVVVASPFRVCN